MNSLGRISATLVVLSLCTAMAGCSGQNDAGQQAEQVRVQQQGKGVQGEMAPSGVRAMSAGMTVRQDVADRLNQMNGVQNATVIVHGGNAYVGLTHVGVERNPDRATRMGVNSWNGMPYGTVDSPKSAAGMTVEQLQAEGITNAGTHASPYSTMTGNIDEKTKRAITKTVQQNVKGVKNVYVSSFVEHTQKLSGYKHYILQGGNMQPHLQEFQQFVARAFKPKQQQGQQQGGMQQQGMQQGSGMAPGQGQTLGQPSSGVTPQSQAWERANGWNQMNPQGHLSPASQESNQPMQQQMNGQGAGQPMYGQPPASPQTRNLNDPQKTGPSLLD